MSQRSRDLSLAGHTFRSDAGYTGGPEQLPELVRRFRICYTRNKDNGWAALHAISLIADKAGQRIIKADDKKSDKLLGELFSQIDPSSPVVLEWWILEALAMAFHRHKIESISIDEALGMKRTGRGNRSLFEGATKAAERINLAREIAWCCANFSEGNVEAAIKKVSDDFKVSESTLWGIWTEHKIRVEMELRTGRL